MPAYNSASQHASSIIAKTKDKASTKNMHQTCTSPFYLGIFYHSLHCWLYIFFLLLSKPPQQLLFQRDISFCQLHEISLFHLLVKGFGAEPKATCPSFAYPPAPKSLIPLPALGSSPLNLLQLLSTSHPALLLAHSKFPTQCQSTSLALA